MASSQAPSLADFVDLAGIPEDELRPPESDDVVPSAPIQFPGDPIEDQIDPAVIEAMFADEEAQEDLSEARTEFHSNLAGSLDDGARDDLAQRVIEWEDADRQSRADWEILETHGMSLLGVLPEQIIGMNEANPGEAGWGFTGMHPGLVQSIVQFWSRVFPELWQNGAPVKSEVFGEAPPEQLSRARRKSDHLNYLYGTEMGDGKEELSQAIFRLPISGSLFRIPYFDPIEGTVRVVNAQTEDFVKPYSATKLRTAARYTYVMRKERNEVLRLTAQGFWRKVDLSVQPDENGSGASSLKAVTDAIEGVAESADSGRSQSEYDHRDKFFVTWCNLNLGDDYKWKDPEHNHEWGGPYRVTVHEETQQVVEIIRDWRQEDAKKRRRAGVAEYKYLPGTRGYGWSVFHLAGGLARAQSALVQHGVDAAILDTQGKFTGWVDENVVGPEDPTLEMGVLKKMRGSGEDMRKAVWRPDYQYSANNNLNTLQYGDGLMGELTASTREMVGDPSKEVAVGTALARIEQHMKPVMAIMEMVHESFGDELRAVSELVYDHLPDGRYPYRVKGQPKEVLREDYSDDDVVPKSSPNVVSMAQRLARYDALVNTALQDQEAFPVEERLAIYRHGMEVMGADDALMQRLLDRIAQAEQMRANPAPPPPDPITEREDAKVASDLDRKAMAADREQDRKDALAAAEVERKHAVAMQGMEDQRAKNESIIASEEEKGLREAADNIMKMARERMRGAAEGQGIPGGEI